jgi:transposase
MSNAYIKRSRISDRGFRQFLKLFCLDLTATQIAEITRLNRNTVNRIVGLIRRRMAQLSEEQARMAGIIEMDESYFGPHRIRGKRGRGASGKTIVFGLHKRGGCVFTQVVPNCSRTALQRVIRGKVALESVIHTDGWPAYDGLVDLGYEKHYRVHHGANEFARGKNHINGIESFWSYAKHRLKKFHGWRKEAFYLHLKECEFRFNHRKKDMYQALLKEFRKSPLI